MDGRGDPRRGRRCVSTDSITQNLSGREPSEGAIDTRLGEIVQPYQPGYERVSCPLSRLEVVQLLSCCSSWTYFTLPWGGSDAVAAGEGFLASRKSKPPASRFALSGPEGPTLPAGE